MEGQNSIDLSKMNIAIPDWQWQCNPDPYKETDPSKWTWQNYPHDSCVILEKALLLNQEIAELGDYEVDLKRMLQVNKKDRNKIRRVRRLASNINQSRFMIEMPEPVIVGADQKTMNQAFGTVQHFLDYIMKRTPESYKLYQSLKKLSLDAKEMEFKEIIEEVILCIKRAAEAREKIIKTRLGPWNQNHILKAEQIVNEIKSKSRSLRDFLRTILRIYTMETFICYWLNELLRSDNWTEINILTPYLVCLVYTFKLADYTVKYPTGFMNTMLGYLNRHQLYLYRGSALTKQQLAQYTKTKGKHFSWNGVTSTSRSRDMALTFAFQSLQFAQSQNIAKVGVLFVIKTNFGSVEDCEGMIDVGPYAVYPKEKEVILAPGTVFQLERIQLNKKNNLYEVNLKVRRKFEEEISLLGALQDQAISKDKAIIEGIPSADSFRILQLLEGNKLIQELEIRNSQIEEHILGMIGKVRASTNLKKQDINLRNNIMYVSSLSVLAHYFSPEGLDDVIIWNKIMFKENEKVKHVIKEKHWKMKKLILREKVLAKLHVDNELKELWDHIKKEVQLTILILSMENLTISEEELIFIWESIRSLLLLESFSLTLNSAAEASGLNLSSLYKTIDSLKSLKKLFLHLGKYAPISDEKLDNLGSTICTSQSLQHLDLDFGFCEQISDKGTSSLISGINSLKHLENLSLGFMRCLTLTDYTLKSFKEQLFSLTSLSNLSLNFAGCNKISDKGLNYLKSCVMPLRTLKNLSLDFGGCNKISNTGLEYLGNIFPFLPSLQDLSLEFWHCRKISDKGLAHLSEKLSSVQALINFSLAFGGCDRISYQGGLRHVENALLKLSSLKKISLDLKGCQQISDSNLGSFRKNIAAHANSPCLSLNERSREDFEPQTEREFRILSKAYSLERRVFLMILMFYLMIKIFGFRLLFYLFLTATVLTVVVLIAENRSVLRKVGIVKIKEDLNEEINQAAKAWKTRKFCDERQILLAGFFFVGFILVFWKYGLIFALLALIALYPVGLLALCLLQAIIVLIAFVLLVSFALAYCSEVWLIKKLNRTVGHSKNQDRVQDIADTFQNYLNNFSDHFGPIKRALENFSKKNVN